MERVMHPKLAMALQDLKRIGIGDTTEKKHSNGIDLLRDAVSRVIAYLEEQEEKQNRAR